MPDPNRSWWWPAAIAAVALAAGRPPTGVGATPDALLVAAAAWAAWVIAGLASAALMLAALDRGRGVVATAARVALRAYPTPVRRWATALVAAAVGTAVAAPASAAASTGHHQHTVVAPALGWPATPAAAAARPRGDDRMARAAVVVRPGECLWSVAARDLGRHAAPARVAAAWPLWWAANRALIGPDPDLLITGQRLLRPTALDERTRR
jgi:resuscitation-promoting factor RpfA